MLEVEQAIMNRAGSFSGFVQKKDAVCGFRDTVGRVPFYYGGNSELVAFASHRKMLWSIGLESLSLTPGSSVCATSKGFNVNRIAEISQPPVQQLSMADSVNSLDKLLSESVQKRVKGLTEVALGFSGGIDSTILGHYLRESDVNVHLINVGVEGSKEFKAAKEAAEALNFDVTIETFSADQVEAAVDDILWIIEDENPVKVAVAIPLHWAAKAAAQRGAEAFFSGNGADELLGGYHRYLGKPRDDAARMMYEDVKSSYTTNYERDYKICSQSGLDLRLPFADPAVIDFGLSLPVEYRVPSDTAQPRKVILRHLAKKLGLPDNVALKRKKAVQYSTGVNNVLLKVARKKGVRLTEWLSMRMDKLKREHLSVSS